MHLELRPRQSSSLQLELELRFGQRVVEVLILHAPVQCYANSSTLEIVTASLVTGEQL